MATERTWLLVERIPETGDRTSSMSEGNAAVRLVVQRIAADLRDAHRRLGEAFDAQTPIELPNTPTKFAGRLVPPVAPCPVCDTFGTVGGSHSYNANCLVKRPS